MSESFPEPKEPWEEDSKRPKESGLRSPQSGELDLSGLARRLQSFGSIQSTEEVLQLGALVHQALLDTATSGGRVPSLRRIAALPGIPFKLTTLWRAVSVYEMSLRLPDLVQTGGLGVSHLRAVIGLEPGEQQRLLALSAELKWTKRQLEKEVARLRHGAARRGRRPQSPGVVWVRELGKMLERGREALTEDQDLQGEARRKALAEWSQLQESCVRLQSLLGVDTERESSLPPETLESSQLAAEFSAEDSSDADESQA